MYHTLIFENKNFKMFMILFNSWSITTIFLFAHLLLKYLPTLSMGIHFCCWITLNIHTWNAEISYILMFVYATEMYEYYNCLL